MKNIFIKSVIAFCVLLFMNCKNTIELYTAKDGCVVYDDTRNVKLYGKIDTSYLSSKKNIKWDLIYIVKKKNLRDIVYSFGDSFQEISIIDSNTILSRNSIYKSFHEDSIKLLNFILNKSFLDGVISNYKSFEIITNVGRYELQLMWLEYPIAVIYNKQNKDYYIFKAKNEMPLY